MFCVCLSLRKRQSLFTFATPNNFYSAVSLSETVEKMLQTGCPCKPLDPVYVLSQTVLSLEIILHHYSQKIKQQHLNVFIFLHTWLRCAFICLRSRYFATLAMCSKCLPILCQCMSRWCFCSIVPHSVRLISKSTSTRGLNRQMMTF